MKLFTSVLTLISLSVLICNTTLAQSTYFIDGYHGGIYGHYPKNFTDFIIKNLDKKPDWNINLEIEPETWDSVKLRYPEAYSRFKNYYEKQYPKNSRIEFVNPAYGQSYFFNISGESIIRHFEYGIKKMKEHFPDATFDTYSSEEPCFTSALPFILKSFGFKYASLKNPNTCWGGYTRAFGGELLNWVGPDGAKIPTVPRYSSEKLVGFSTWQTQAWTNSEDFFSDAMKQGIKNPIGMCLQDAGWTTGPWLNNKQGNTQYITWYNYFNNVASKPTIDWKLTQEDIQVSLVWGSQKLQQIAQRVRSTENKIVQAEKLSTIAQLQGGYYRPDELIDEAWRNLLLAQHHDCWIVPLHWYKRAMQWLDKSNQLADEIIASCKKQLTNPDGKAITVINTSAVERKETVRIKVARPTGDKSITIEKADGTKVSSQIVRSLSTDSIEIIFQAKVGATAAAGYRIVEKDKATSGDGYLNEKQNYLLETDLYRLRLNSTTGVVESLITKKDNKEWIDQTTRKKFNEIGGYFYQQQRFLSSADGKNEISILANGSLEKTAEIKGKIGDHLFVQKITLVTGQPAIDFETTIHWSKSEGVGDSYAQKSGYKSEDFRKAFYTDTSKLCIYFPANLKNVTLYKDAPFDVTESRLANTFFATWDSIKNNIIYRWVDIADRKQKKGLALFSDHTTSYSHGTNFPLALTIAYSGMGLWNGNYRLQDSTKINYSIIPHSGKWDVAKLNTTANNIAEPLIVMHGKIKKDLKSIIDLSGTGYELTALNLKDNKLIARFYNGEGKTTPVSIKVSTPFEKAIWINLDGTAHTKATVNGNSVIKELPKHGIATLAMTLRK